jgi:hypothetical protein
LRFSLEVGARHDLQQVSIKRRRNATRVWGAGAIGVQTVQFEYGPIDLLLRRCRYTLARKLKTAWLVNAVFTLQIAIGSFAGACQVVWACEM